MKTLYCSVKVIDLNISSKFEAKSKTSIFMKRLFYSFVFIAITFNLYGQKVKSEKLSHISFELPPRYMELNGFDTYDLTIKTVTGDPIVKSSINGAIQTEMSKYKQTHSQENGQYTVDVNLVEFNFEKPKQIKGVKSENGKNVTKYSYEGSYDCMMLLKIQLKDGKVVYTDTVKGEGRLKGNSTDLDVSAKKVYESQKKPEIIKKSKDISGLAVRNMIGQFFYTPRSIEVDGYWVKPKKYDYTKFNEAFQNFKKVILSYREGKFDEAETQTLFNSTIEIWESELSQTEPDNNKARIDIKIAGVLYYQLGVLYFMKKDYQKSHAYFKQAIEYKTSNYSTRLWTDYSREMIDRAVNERS